ncbi:cellulase family glycosylhydrolase [Flavobacterium nackdongense]|uniref:mannan endo-1,4-beta-mannosidase n=1 Tax=Flavobacterium nackdongense TaxID=2547394 RepID=A0A4P6YGA8_9FLAO|nr:cellulase family glycosylhydrolase [Flavobacterium nackdongense]QBN19503.1 DUF5060 domain-containing protein [Flavobacterium nackdongense]
MKNKLFIITFLVFSVVVKAQIQEVTILNKEVIQYQKTEWDIRLLATFVNPFDFSEISLDMILTAPTGEKLVLPCFFVSGKSGSPSLWKARFTPREKGKYSYHFELKKASAEVFSSQINTFNVKPSKAKGFLNTNNLWTFKYDNGTLFRGIGENICWESRDDDDSKYFKKLHEDKRFNYNFMLKKLAANGGNFFRTWMIYWNLPVDWKKVQNNSRYQNSDSYFNESGMKRMDELVQLCDSLGIHMMLALESHVGLMGSGWETSNYNIANGGFAKTPTEFFALPAARAQYKNKLRLMVARYGYSPSVGAWEFFNEVDNAMYNGGPDNQIPADVVTNWHNEMSTFLKSIDPYKHIVATSVSHRDIPGMNDLKNIDINQRHMYKNTSGIPATILEYTAKHNKPYVIGEAGFEWDWSKDFNAIAPEMDADFRRALWLGLFSPTPVLPMSWWWEFFENRGMMSYFEMVKKVNDQMISDGKGEFEIVNIKSLENGLEIYGVRCGKTTYVYVYNSASTKKQLQFQNMNWNKIKGNLELLDTDLKKYSSEKFSVSSEKVFMIDTVLIAPKQELVIRIK